ncbi:MAG: PCMD domain-containing protein [Bacteroidetes bacterium]|nr:PCMD domain-containing protein [Bacteroidota bacterium]
MLKINAAVILCLFVLVSIVHGQTIIPNASFESWTNYGNYSNPTGWDTPNQELMSIPLFGITVVSKSTDHQGTGSFSAKLETKHLTIPSQDIPGFMTCGTFTINMTTGVYILSGGVPVVDKPTHLKGYFKYYPKGGDSCVIGIGLTRTTGAIRDTIGLGSFSARDTVTDWTPFSAWINYINTAEPDTMNIIALSTVQSNMTVGTTLYVDDLYLDYTVSSGKKDPDAGISVYNDLETKRLMIFFNLEEPENIRIRLISMMGQEVSASESGLVSRERQVIGYSDLSMGVYVLEILHGNKVFSKKFFLNK